MNHRYIKITIVISILIVISVVAFFTFNKRVSVPVTSQKAPESVPVLPLAKFPGKNIPLNDMTKNDTNKNKSFWDRYESLSQSEWRIMTEEGQKREFHSGKNFLRTRSIIPEVVIKELNIKAGQTILDIGCGEGYLTFPIASVIGKKGKVFASDIDEKKIAYMLQMIRKFSVEKNRNFDNIIVRLNHVDNIGIDPGKIDQAIMLDVHILFFRQNNEASGIAEDQEKIVNEIYKSQKAFMTDVYKALKKNGKITLIEHSGKQIAVNKKHLLILMKKFGFILEKQKKDIPGYPYFMTFKKG